VFLEEIHSLVQYKDKVVEGCMDLNSKSWDRLFKIIDKSQSGVIEPDEIINMFTAYEQWVYDKAKTELMLDEIDAQESYNSKKSNRCRRYRKATYSAPYELSLNVFGLLQFCTLIIRTAKDADSS